jgi:hypothetical protein
MPEISRKFYVPGDRALENEICEKVGSTGVPWARERFGAFSVPFAAAIFLSARTFGTFLLAQPPPLSFCLNGRFPTSFALGAAPNSEKS